MNAADKPRQAMEAMGGQAAQLGFQKYLGLKTRCGGRRSAAVKNGADERLDFVEGDQQSCLVGSYRISD